MFSFFHFSPLLSLSNDLQLTVFSFNEFGKGFPKSQKISPDAYVQVAMQLTYYK